ncbi:hypothetical protein Bca52824_010920 [Brassica carinata]|uniref:RING-type domain-containing protein n=1 Tax=Brassica carinata TaxID=52824 RepID=A0A8X8BB60_BRACI|nr:hypothetical protein Bca52824_010920 [Brassica carinata]
MRAELYHKINYFPEPEDADTIKINVRMLCGDDIVTSSTWQISEQQFHEGAYESLESFLREELEIGINHDDITDMTVYLLHHIDEVICSAFFSFSLEVWLALYPLSNDDDDAQLQEAAQRSFDETSNISSRPASKLVVESLTRRTYMTKIEKEEKNKIDVEGCTICLQEFSEGATVVTLPCGHDFDDECIVKWLEISPICPVCRFELPRE